RGNFRVRSVRGDGLNPSPEEIAYQKRWMEQLKLTPEELTRRRCAGVAKGVVVASAQREQEALDANFNDFSAGAFTYLMTQYLWQQTDSVGSAIAQVTQSIKPISSQVPLADGNSSQPVYFINQNVPPTDAVITQVKGDRATLWLGGLDKESLDAFQSGATFTIVNDKGQASGQLKLESRRGLIGEAKLVEKTAIAFLKPGMFLQESSRVVPAGLKLNIGLDPSLAGETNAAKQALSALNRIEAIPAQLGNTPYPGGVQYILSRMTTDAQQILQEKQATNIPDINSIGLFTEGLELVPKSFGEPGETVTAAVSRLEPKIKSILAARIIKKTLNANSSEVDVEVSMNLVEQPNQILARASTRKGRNNRLESERAYPNKLPLNKLFQFQVINRESNVLHFTTLLIDSSGGLVVVFPHQWPASEESMQLKPNQTQLIGDPQKLKLKAIEKGTGEALIIVSRSPLKKAVKTLEALAAELNRSQGPVELKEPVEVMGDLLDDLSRDRMGGLVAESRPINASEIVTLSITFEVG
ncbi:MAG: peptidase C14, partial [Cyanobacteriota bacterium]